MTVVIRHEYLLRGAGEIWDGKIRRVTEGGENAMKRGVHAERSMSPRVTLFVPRSRATTNRGRVKGTGALGVTGGGNIPRSVYGSWRVGSC